MAAQTEHRAILESLARHAMLERGLLPDFSAPALAELKTLQVSDIADGKYDGQLDDYRDLRPLLWASIDNDESRDLDQLSVGEQLPDGRVKILVAVADVDTLVRKGSALDEHAGHNTTTVYTAAKIFPMLPEPLSTGMTSLNQDVDRFAIVVELVVSPDGSVRDGDVFQAIVRNRARLSYNAVAAWLDGEGKPPAAVAAVTGLDENLRLQDRVAEKMKQFRHAHGALSLQTIQARPFLDGDQIRLEIDEKNRAKEMIENFMIAANGVVARFLSAKSYPSIRRVVRAPKRWERIVELAAGHGTRLPAEPDSKALETFLGRQRAADPARFPELSLAIVKLIGPGEYAADLPGDPPPGHFGLAVKDYTHSTAPNRRFTDLITHRLLKAAMQARPVPYTGEELEFLAAHCTATEDAANKVERQVNKSAAALLLESRIGEQFDAMVTGAAAKGTWVRLLKVPVEGKLVQGHEGVDVGQRVRVRLVSVDVGQGFIDFRKVG